MRRRGQAGTSFLQQTEEQRLGKFFLGPLYSKHFCGAWSDPPTEAKAQRLHLFVGFPLSYGVFQNYYFEHEPFRGNKNIQIVGTVATGITYLGALFTTPFVKKYQRYQRHMVCLGWSLCIVSLIAGSFATQIGTLIFTQGILYGTGVLILYYPLLSMVNEWFVQKRGLAYGILSCATGVTGVAFPFIIEALLMRYGYATTLRALGIGIAILTGPCLPMLRGRLPPSQESAMQKTDWSFLKTPLFCLYATSNLCQAMGYWFPGLFLPSYATSLGLSPATGALLLALFSMAQVGGQLTFGFLSDGRLPLHFLLLLSPLVSAIAAFTLWGFSHSLPPLSVFSLIYGFFGAGYVVLWGRMGMALSDDPTAALATYSVFAFQKGIGNVLAGPISAAVLLGNTNTTSYGVLRYQNIIILTGAGMLLSSLSVGAWYLKPTASVARRYTSVASTLLSHWLSRRNR
ncbi:hypothetical protein MMC17_005538 [Xylographa soralifera]|nr:hypothetical protein [Xylographa soralifera]